MSVPYKPEPYVDDSDITEIIIQPDGRIYAFGLSMEVAAVLEQLQRDTESPIFVQDQPVVETHVNVGGMHEQA